MTSIWYIKIANVCLLLYSYIVKIYTTVEMQYINGIYTLMSIVHCTCNE